MNDQKNNDNNEVNFEDIEDTNKTVFMKRILEGESIEEAKHDADMVHDYIENNTIDGKLRGLWKRFKYWIMGVLGGASTALGIALQEKIMEFINSL